MSISANAASYLLERAARDVRVAFALGVVQAIVALIAISRDAFLNNEGIFSYLFAGMLADDPLPILFLMKARPPLAAFYALPSVFGFDTFAIVHALVAAAAVPLTAVLARASGHERPNLAAALVAASPLMVAGAASGIGNSDATTLGVLAAVLLFAWKRPLLAGVVASVLPFARAEMSILVLALTSYVLLAGGAERLRFVVGLAVPPIVYLTAGMLYHGDGLWFVHYPPHVTHSVPFSEIMGRQMFGGEPHQIALNFILLTPAVGLLLFLRLSQLSRAERTLGSFLLVFLGILSILPALHPLNFGDMPRYVLPALPFLALLSGRAVESLAGAGEADSRIAWAFGIASLLALLIAAHFQDARHGAPALLWAVAAWSLVALLAATQWRRALPASVLVLALVAALPLLGKTRLSLSSATSTLGRYLLEHASAETIVLTNVSELPMWLARNGGAHLDVHHVLAADQRYEIDLLTNDAVGQRASMHALMREHWYGSIVFPEEIESMLRPGTWLAMRPDARTGHVLDYALLEGRSDAIELREGMRVIRVVVEP